MSTPLSTWLFAAVSWSKLSMTYLILESCFHSSPSCSLQNLIHDFEYLVSKNHLASNFARRFYRSNNFDGIIFTIQLNILVIAEEFETLAIDPRSRHSLVAYLGGRSFKFGSKRRIFWSKYRCVLPFSVQAGNGLLQLPYWSAQQIELKYCLNQWWDEKYFPISSINAGENRCQLIFLKAWIEGGFFIVQCLLL